MPSHPVSSDVKQRLDVSNAVIQRVGKLLIMGQANQVNGNGQNPHDHWHAQTHNAAIQDAYSAVSEGWHRLAVHKPTWLNPQKTTELDMTRDISAGHTNLTRPQRVAGIALHFRVGNCQEFASVTYLLLRENLCGQDAVHYVNGRGPHWYCLVTDANCQINVQQDVPDDAVVVDPWIASPQPEALLWRHSVHKVSFQVQYSQSKCGTKWSRNTTMLDLGKVQAAMKKYENHVDYLYQRNKGKYPPDRSWAHSEMVDRVGPASHLWDERVLWNGVRYDYIEQNNFVNQNNSAMEIEH